jgi:tyrosyl-tRNA synthetase
MYLQFATAWDPETIDAATRDLAEGRLHPNAAKRLLGRTVADLYHGAGAGAAAEAEFDRVFKAHEAPDEVAEHEIAVGTLLADALVASGLAPSKREARRLMDQGGVKVDGNARTEDGKLDAGTYVVQVGRRRWARLRVGD